MNNAAIRSAKPGAILWDDRIPGLHLRCFANRKSWYLKYRTKDGRHQRRPKIGDLDRYSLAQAREEADAILKAVARGDDPMATREARSTALTMTQLAARYMWHIRSDAKDRKKPAQVKEDLRKLKTGVRPRWGRRLATDITTEDVEALHKAMARSPYAANRMLSLLSRMFNLAEKWKVRPSHSNPCRFVTRYPEAKRRRHMTGDEAPRVAAALAAEEAEFPAAVLFIYLLILTGARPDEIARAGLKDIVGNQLILAEHKTDSTMAPRVIYLPTRIMEMIQTVATKDSLTGLESPRHVWRRIRVAAGCPDLRLYDLRRTFASAALRAGYTLDQIGELLGHTSGTTSKHYAWMMEDVRAQATEKTAGVLTEMMAPKTGRPAELPAPGHNPRSSEPPEKPGRS